MTIFSELDDRVREWQMVQTELAGLEGALDELEEHLNELKKSRSPELGPALGGHLRAMETEMETTQELLEEALGEHLRAYDTCRECAARVLAQLDGPDATSIRERLEALSKKLRVVEWEIGDRRRRVDQKLSDDSDIRDDLDAIQFWSETCVC
jgi:hypothetical protein